ncbi:hypothetical protein VTO42DRAFT_2943 [Malbranchea cinnamomea]
MAEVPLQPQEASVENGSVFTNQIPHYAPNQPYFSGVFETGFAKQALHVFVGIDPLRLRPLRPPPFHNPPEHLACPNFFNYFHDDQFEREFGGVHWKYTMRREAQEILPYLWIGPASVARNPDYLSEHGITLLLGIRAHPFHAHLVNGTRAAQTVGISCEHVEVNGMTEFAGMLMNIVRGINEHVCRCPRHAPDPTKKLNKVLVFCETGNEKSLTVVVAYLMAMLDLDLVTAVYNVQARRLCANFDVNQRDMLLSFEMLLSAQRDVARTLMLAPNSAGCDQPRKKRSYLEMAMDEDATGGMDHLDVRHQPPPFCDKDLNGLLG